MTVILAVAGVSDRAMLLFHSHLCDLHFHQLHAHLVFIIFYSLILSCCNDYVRRSKLKLKAVRVIQIILFSLEKEFERKLLRLQVI
jgi:hypothetical protein